MRYMVFVIDDRRVSGTPDELRAIDEFNASLQARGFWITAGGLEAPHAATLIDNRAGLNDIRLGSLFTNTDFYSGFWLIECPDHETAEVVAREGSRACNRRVELRPFLA